MVSIKTSYYLESCFLIDLNKKQDMLGMFEIY